MKRLKYNRRFVNVVVGFGGKPAGRGRCGGEAEGRRAAQRAAGAAAAALLVSSVCLLPSDTLLCFLHPF